MRWKLRWDGKKITKKDELYICVRIYKLYNIYSSSTYLWLLDCRICMKSQNAGMKWDDVVF